MVNPSFVAVGTMTFVSVEKITVVFPNIRSEPVKKVIAERRERGMVLDCTNGKKTRSAILTSDGYILLSPKMPKTIVKNIRSFDDKDDDDDDDDDDGCSDSDDVIGKDDEPVGIDTREPDELLDSAIDNRDTDSVF